jgi:hypothetical protein
VRKAVPVALTIGFVAIFIWLLGSLAWTTSRGAAQMPLYSAYRFDPYGSAALQRFLLASGGRVTLLTHPILPKRAAGVLVNITAPYQRGMLENYSTGRHYNPRLLRWIAAGNTLLDFTQNPTGLTHHLNIHVLGLVGIAGSDKHGKKLSPKKQRGEHQRRPRHPHLRAPDIFPKWLTIMQNGENPKKLQRWIHFVSWNNHNASNTRLSVPPRTLELLAPAYLMIPKHHKQWRVLARTKAGPVAIERTLGKGRVIFVGSPWPALNGGIGAVNNLDFLRAIIGNRPVILDQWSLGVGHNYTTLDILRRYGLMPALLELVLLLIAYAWSCRGYPPVKSGASGTMTRSSVEHIAMLGRLYEGALSEMEIFQRVNQEVRLRLALALRCRPDQIEERIKRQSDSVAQAWQLLTQQLRVLEGEIRERSGESARQKAGRHRQLADLMTQSWQLAKEIHHGGHSGPDTTANHRSAGRGPGRNKESHSRAGIPY